MLEHVERREPPGFACWSEPDRERLVVRTRGEVDLAVADEVHAALAEAIDAGFAVVVWDLEGVTFIDTAGMAVARATHRLAEKVGAQFVVERCPARVRRAFALSGLDGSLVFAACTNR